VRAECAEAAAAYRLVLPGHPLAGRLGDRLGRGTGSSLEFMDFRDYVPGDDLRHVDWRAFARTRQLKVRLFREETAPSLDIVVDTSASMVVTEAKRQALVDLVDAVAEWTSRGGGQPRRLAAEGSRLEPGDTFEFTPGDPHDLVPRVPLRPRVMRMIVSDFLRPEDPAPRLRRLAAGASHLYVLQLLDGWEVEPTADGASTLIECEDDSHLDVVLDAETVRRYRDRLTRLRESVVGAVRSVGATYAMVVAGSPAEMFRGHLMPQGVVEPA
jgi:uncharacterized protein (DUF58 family)